jgi:hypothetical protein
LSNFGSLPIELEDYLLDLKYPACPLVSLLHAFFQNATITEIRFVTLDVVVGIKQFEMRFNENRAVISTSIQIVEYASRLRKCGTGCEGKQVDRFLVLLC